MKNRQIFIEDNEKAVVEKLREQLENCANAALREKDYFYVGLSGGSLIDYLGKAIPKVNSDLSKWKFFFCDERYVPEADDDSTFGAYKKKVIPLTNLSVSQFYPIDVTLSLEECAKKYEYEIVKELMHKPIFDLLLLGMGPDGHTCSLFPDHELLHKDNVTLIAAISDSPKPPPQRVTMTLHMINSSKCCIFAMCGAGKADMVKRVFIDNEELPAAMVQPINGNLICIFDKAAGKYFKPQSQDAPHA